MSWTVFLMVFSGVFVAELGDKTQLATMLFASKEEVSGWTVFFASSAALVSTSALGVLAGTALSRRVDPAVLSWVAGLGFIAVGVWTLWRA